MWRYTLADLTDSDDPEQWATALADQGWQMWVPTGVLVTINGRTVRRYSLRRWVELGRRGDPNAASRPRPVDETPEP